MAARLRELPYQLVHDRRLVDGRAFSPVPLGQQLRPLVRLRQFVTRFQLQLLLLRATTSQPWVLSIKMGLKN